MSEYALQTYFTSPDQAKACISHQIVPFCKNMWANGQKRLTVTIGLEKRSQKENRMLHSMLGHIAKTQEWAGKKRDIETWKRLLTAAWCRARNEQVELLPALDGHGVDIVFRRTSQLTRGECAELIDFVYAWATDSGIQFPAYVDPETGEILR